MTKGFGLVAAAVFLSASFGVACGGDSEPDGTTETPRPEPVTETPVAGNAPDVKVFPVEKCELVPGGSLSGGDVINFSLPVVNVGNVVIESLVTIRAEGGSGLIGTKTVAVPEDTESSTAASVAITGQEYGEQQRYTIRADPENVIAELDESNNETVVLVDFPPAPPSGEVALTCDSPAP